MYEGANTSARGLHGPRLFGLAHPQVLGLLQQLPHAARCEGYKGWHGRPPDTPPMVRLAVTVPCHIMSVPLATSG